jgi:hypothetical protein
MYFEKVRDGAPAEKVKKPAAFYNMLIYINLPPPLRILVWGRRLSSIAGWTGWRLCILSTSYYMIVYCGAKISSFF